jgi:hypothetical protein
MTGDDRLQEFLQAIEDWKTSKYLRENAKRKEDYEDHVYRLLNMSEDKLKTLSATECLIKAYELYSHAEYVESVKAKEKIILEWAESSIWFIISAVLNQYGGQYAKWQEKYYAAVRENPLATEILKIKNHAEARVQTLEGKHSRIMKMADVLTNLARRK